MKSIFNNHTAFKKSTIKYRLRKIYNSFNSIFWNKIKTDSAGIFILDKEKKKYQHLTPNIDSKIDSSLYDYCSKTYTEYIYKYNSQVIIEPKFGWGLIKPNKILYYSLPYHYYTNPPDLFDLFILYYNSSKKHSFKTVISLRDVGEGNYFHTFNDILSKLILLKKNNLEFKFPLVLSKNLYDKQFFVQLINRIGINQLDFVVQADNYIVAKEVIFCKAMPLNREYFENYYDLLKVPYSDPNKKRRIFINRSKKNARNIENINEILEIVNKYGFEHIRLEELNLDEQIKLFSDTRYLIGIHGAGLTNMFFRRNAELSVIEIFPPNNIPPHYYWLAHEFGYSYDAILGEYLESQLNNQYKITDNINFSLSPIVFEKKIETLLR